jgi:hypothetical protein
MTSARRGILFFAVFVVGCLVFANSTSNGFVLDDRKLVEENPLIRSLGAIPVLFQADYWAPHSKSGLYRPLVTTSYALEHQLTAGSPRGHHVTNVVLHGLISVFVLLVFLRFVADPMTAAAGALLFATHAIHAEVVANIAGRAELLAALLFLVALLLVVECRRHDGRAARGLYVASLATYLLSLLSKESGVTLVGIVFLYDLVCGPDVRGDLLPRVGRTLARHWQGYAGYVGITALYLGMRYWALGPDSLPPLIRLDNPIIMLDVPWRVLNALHVALRYLLLLFFPLHLSYDYSYDQIPLITELGDPRGWLVVATWGLIVAFLVWAWRRLPGLFLAASFYFVTFSVTSNVVILIGTIMAERLVYLPSAGFCLALAVAIRTAAARLPVPARTATLAFAGAFGLVVVSNGVRAVDRNRDWRSQADLYLHDVEIVPGSAKALGNAGAILVGRGENERALEMLHRAVEIAPQFETAYKMAGFAYTALGRDEEAMRMYDQAVRYGDQDPAVYNNLGFILVDRGLDVSRGIRLLEKAIGYAPGNAEFLDSLGWAYFKAGRLEEARVTLERSLAADGTGPTSPSRREHLAAVERAIAERRDAGRLQAHERHGRVSQ